MNEIQVISIKCPNCGASLSTSDEICGYCNSPVIIKTFESIANMSLPQLNKYVRSYSDQSENSAVEKFFAHSVGICFLKLKIYDKAIQAFEKTIEEDFNNVDAYFYAAVSLLQGKKAFLLSRSDADKAIQYLNAAYSIKPNEIYTYFHAYIKLDYFKRKFFNVPPSFEQLIAQCSGKVPEADKQEFFGLLGVERPSAI